MILIKPPHEFAVDFCFSEYPRVFLAGSIEMGTAEDWQKWVEGEFVNDNLIILNPRRDHWDPTWEQSINNSKFKEQVEWELEGQEDSDVIAMYFDPKTKAPITLLELGLFHKKMIVCCPAGFYRKGNVDIVCNRYKVPLVTNLPDLVSAVKAKIKKK